MLMIVPFFLPFIPLITVPASHHHSPTLVHVHISGLTYKFFCFFISHTILNLLLYILYLPFMLLIPCTFPPLSPLPLPPDNPLCGLYFCESVPVLVDCLIHFYFLDSVVDSCEFVVILLFVFLIFFFFLDKSL